jgi:predicted RNA-binding protein with PIN domain
MPYLIDGYNLLFATGHLTSKTGRQSLEGARKALLIQLVTGHGPDVSGVTVVFDARSAPPGIRPHDDHGGVRILFSQGQTADDLIEELIRDEPSPRLLTVVSDDHRIQHAARRRGCVVMGCLDYYEGLQTRSVRPPPPREPPSKPERMTAEETQRWLDVFKDADETE